MFDQINLKFIIRMAFTLMFLFCFSICFVILDFYITLKCYTFILPLLFPTLITMSVSTGTVDLTSYIVLKYIFIVLGVIFLIFLFCCFLGLIINVKRTDKVKGDKIYFTGTGWNKEGHELKEFKIDIIDYVYIKRFLFIHLLYFVTKDKIFAVESFFNKYKYKYYNKKYMCFDSEKEAKKFLQQNHLEKYLKKI